MVRRVLGLHQNLATALASSEAAVKQAKGASDHCEHLMEEIEELKVRDGERKGGMGEEREEWREEGMNRWREGGRRGITVKGGRG